MVISVLKKRVTTKMEQTTLLSLYNLFAFNWGNSVNQSVWEDTVAGIQHFQIIDFIYKRQSWPAGR